MKLYLSIVFIAIIQFHMNAQNWKTPTIEGYGRIVDYENVAIQPNPTTTYKMFFHITTSKEREGVNISLWKMARTVNLLENSGVPKKNIQLAAVTSGPATPIVLSADAYLERMEKPNPNIDLIDKLVDYGVTIHLCGQAAAKKKINPKTDLNPQVKLTLSALIDIPTYQIQGYTIIR
ncbi:DsrE family protein [Mesonia sp.]|uniref:DsrE family protein n=1 Tax=Mesonia sp. TaxID=1960830 RepID=UPI003F95A803